MGIKAAPVKWNAAVRAGAAALYKGRDVR